MQISILGSGKVAHTLGAAWQRAGHTVTLGVRDPGAADTSGFRTVSLQAALDSGELVVNAITGAAALAAITALDTNGLNGKVLLDVTNAITADGDLVYPNSSLAEQIQRALPTARVVKSLNTAAIEVQADPSLAGPANLFLSGDDADAKATVATLLTDLGWQPEQLIDLGNVGTARAAEHYILLFFATIGALGTPFFNIEMSRRAE